MHVPAPGHIVLASNVAALSMPNGSIHLVANSPCGSRADGGEVAWGTLPLNAIVRPLCRLAVVTAVSVRGAVGPSICNTPVLWLHRSCA